MSSKSSPSTRLRRLAKEEPHYFETSIILHDVHHEVGHAADRAVAIMGSAMVEQALKVAILEKFETELGADELSYLFNPENGGPISSLASRNHIAYALGIYGPITFKNVKSVTVIRNAFAHASTVISFETDEVKEVCSELSLAQIGPEKDEPGNAKESFTRTISFLVSRLRVHLDVKPDNQLTLKQVRMP